MKGIIERMAGLGRSSDHFGGALWKATEMGCSGMSEPEREPLVAGMLLGGKYKVERFLFWDGRCNHYLATDTEGERPYELREFFNDQDIEVERKILAKQLYHRGMVRRHDLFGEGSRSYVVLDYQEAPNLEDTQRILSDRDLFSIAFNLVDTLEYLHRHGIAQVDLSTRNIRDMGKTQKIVDFAGCRLFSIPATKDLREARRGDFLDLVDLLERLMLTNMNELGDSSLLRLVDGLEEMVDCPPLSAEDFKERLFQCSTVEAESGNGRQGIWADTVT
jgi:serine/threonine protein kinase